MTEEEKAEEAKRQFDEIRSYLLETTEYDGNGLEDRPFDEELLTYRQALRDLPETSTLALDENGILKSATIDPDGIGVTWPAAPLRYHILPRS